MTVRKANPGAVPLYTAGDHTLCSLSDKGRSHQPCPQVGLPLLTRSVFVETYLEPCGSSLEAWPWGHRHDPRLARGDTNVLPDLFCLAAACDQHSSQSVSRTMFRSTATRSLISVKTLTSPNAAPFHKRLWTGILTIGPSH